MTMTYFGKPWNAPAVQDARRGRRPLGRRCRHCGYWIGPRACGWLMTSVEGAHWPAVQRTVTRPWHRECLYASTGGGHTTGNCSCAHKPRTPYERYKLAVTAWNDTCAPDLRTRVPRNWRNALVWYLPFLVMFTGDLGVWVLHSRGWALTFYGIACGMYAFDLIGERRHLRTVPLFWLLYLCWILVLIATVFSFLNALQENP